MKYKTLFRQLFLIVLVLSSGIAALAQYRGNPVKKDKLVDVLRSRQLQTREIVDVIKSNGVDFPMTQPVEVELTSAGARPEVIAAARANYRAPASSASTKSPAVPVVKSRFTGKPLDKDAVVTLLENGVADAQVRKNIQDRGVSFKATASDKAEIKKAGGSVALVNLIAASYSAPTSPGGTTGTTTPTTGGRDDDDLLDSTISTDPRATQASIDSLLRSVKANPNQARAYQQLGYIYLYGQKNYTEAEKYFREAINRGGSAVFRVFHGHDAFMDQTCQGSLFIAKDSVRFESDNNVHTFETTDANIKKVGMSSFWKSVIKTRSGTFKFSLKSGEKESVGFTFAPLTDNSAESKMIIRLVEKQ